MAWEIGAGHRLGRPGLTAPILKTVPMPPGLYQQEHGFQADTVDVLVTIDKDGRVKPAAIQKSLDRTKGGLDDQAREIVANWVFEPGLMKGKPVRVAAVLSVPFGPGHAMPPGSQPDPRSLEWARGLRSPYQPGVSTPIRIMSMTPALPATVAASGSFGSVEIAAEILPDGAIGRMLVLKSVGKAGDGPALSVVKEWRFLPARADGVPVTTYMVVTISYGISYGGPDGPTP